ncbi:MAG: cupin domain-containing protein [Bacteroidota bacterium]
MANLKAYLESGIIEKYCLGVATPEEIRQLERYSKECPEFMQMLNANQQFFEQFLHTFERKPPKNSKQKIIDRIRSTKALSVHLNDQQGLNTFIPLDANANFKHWQQLIRPIHPKVDFDNIYVHPLFSDANRQLLILWIKDYIPEEVHPQLDESFFILEGSCICSVQGVDHHLKAGSFMRMPPDRRHYFKVTSPKPVKAILSRVKVA